MEQRRRELAAQRPRGWLEWRPPWRQSRAEETDGQWTTVDSEQLAAPGEPVSERGGQLGRLGLEDARATADAQHALRRRGRGRGLPSIQRDSQYHCTHSGCYIRGF